MKSFVKGKFSKRINVSNRMIGDDYPAFVIAEAGVAHFGDPMKALKLVDMASDAGADAIKFQIFRTEDLISTESMEWRNRLKTKELPCESFKEIQAYCKSRNIIFFATAHDEGSLEFLDTLDVPVYKIGSGEVENWPFVKEIASRKKPIILSTGMYRLEEVSHALSIMAEAGNRDVIVLHCVTLYPSPPHLVNLKAMDTIRKAFHVLVGYSDHTQGFHFPLAAVARGACMVEKHITLDFNVPDAQDWKVSCGPADFPVMVKQIRQIEEGLGSGIKMPSEDELSSLNWARKSLVAKEDISKGTVIGENLLCTKRPGSGIPPSDMEKVIGKKARVKIGKDELIKWEHLT
jgi:N,N'-diacetyllegionaminate synthase